MENNICVIAGSVTSVILIIAVGALLTAFIIFIRKGKLPIPRHVCEIQPHEQGTENADIKKESLA